MGKKKKSLSKKRLIMETKDISEPTLPEISPYCSRPHILYVGASRVKYTVLEHHVEQLSNVTPVEDFQLGPFIEVPNVHEDIGHTFVHYLYTGEYQTLSLGTLERSARRLDEYRQSLLVYEAAGIYKVDGLQELAKSKAKSRVRGLSVYEILSVAKDIPISPPDYDTWFHSHLKKRLIAAFELDETVFTEDRFLDSLGDNPSFIKLVVKCMTEVYTKKISTMSQVPADENPPETRGETLNSGEDIPAGMPTDDVVSQVDHVSEEPKQDQYSEKLSTEIKPDRLEYDGETHEYDDDANFPEADPTAEHDEATEIPVEDTVDEAWSAPIEAPINYDDSAVFEESPVEISVPVEDLWGVSSPKSKKNKKTVSYSFDNEDRKHVLEGAIAEESTVEGNLGTGQPVIEQEVPGEEYHGQIEIQPPPKPLSPREKKRAKRRMSLSKWESELPHVNANAEPVFSN